MAYQLCAVFIRSSTPLTLVLVSLGLALFDASRLPMLEAAVCARWYLAHNPSAIGSDGLVPERMCKDREIQTSVAQINGGHVHFGALSALLLAMPYAWLATKIDKRRLVLLGAISTALQYAYFYTICRFTTGSVKMVWFAHLFDVIGGGTRITYTMLWSLITEATQPALRSSVFFTISSALLLVQFAGMTFSGLLLQTSPWTVAPIASLVYAVNTPVVFVSLLHSHLQMHPRLVAEGETQAFIYVLEDEVDTEPSRTGSESPGSVQDPEASFLTTTLKNMTTFVQLLYRQFLQHVIFQLSFLMHALIVIAMGLEMIMQQWVSHAFGWTLPETTWMVAYTMFVSFVVLATLPGINTRLRSRFKNTQALDFHLVWTYLLIRALGTLALGFSRHPSIYFISLTISTLGVGLYDSVKALLTSFAPADRTTELYTVLSMLEQLAGMAGSQLWPRVFAGTLAAGSIGMGLPFFLGALCYLGAFMILTRLPAYLDGNEGSIHSEW